MADDCPVNVTVLPGLDHLLLHSLQMVTVAKEPGLALEAPSLRDYQRAAKRAMDVVAGGVLLALTAPLMAAMVLAIRIDSRGPAFFRQQREGLRGETFDVVKFRTMRDGACDEEPSREELYLQKPCEDPGSPASDAGSAGRPWTSSRSLWNVVRGDMSLVGPRPLPLWEAERLGLGRRLVVRPGITGLGR